MVRFILLSFFFLGWAFYEVSGGTDFSARLAAKRQEETARLAAEQAARQTQAVQAAQAENDTPAITGAMVTRASYSAEQTMPTPADGETTAPAQEPQTAEIKDDPAIQTVEAEPLPDIRAVTGSRVNVRMGPATSYNVVLRLTKGTRVRILQEPGNGWVKLKVEETGRVGWMASRLLTKLEG